MPNWCSNNLVIPIEMKDQVINKENEVDFSILIPMPDEEADNWYEWNIANWGTKWNADESYFTEYEDHIEIYFATAWSPPEEWFCELALQNPEHYFHMRYREEGMCFAGQFIASEGHVNDDDETWRLQHKCPNCKDGYGYEIAWDDCSSDYECDTCGTTWVATPVGINDITIDDIETSGLLMSTKEEKKCC